mmetsp:Transcript_14108/g.17574  ORF Transcript_14108/g.17574 Transcript_14108/m.17574 type:complete len:553 (+) Transcript_14108:3-1661(+)
MLSDLEIDDDDDDESHSSWAWDAVDKIVRKRGTRFEVRYHNGRVHWWEEEELRKHKKQMVDEFLAEEPARKKRRRATRCAEKVKKDEACEILASEISKDALLSLFLWETSQAFKSHFSSGKYKYMKKISYRCNYASRLSLEVLTRASRERFAPPLQHYKLCLDVALSKLDGLSDLQDMIFEFAHLPTTNNWPIKAFLGLPTQLAQSLAKKKRNEFILQISLPKPVLETTTQTRCIPHSIWEKQRLWWADFLQKDRSLARNIAKCETVISNNMAFQNLAYPLLRLDPKIDLSLPHSLELLVRQNDAFIGTMIIPNDASLSELQHWLQYDIGSNLRHSHGRSFYGWCYLNLNGKIIHRNHTFERITVRMSRLHDYDRQYRSYNNWTDLSDEDSKQETKIFSTRKALLDFLHARADERDLKPVELSDCEPPEYKIYESTRGLYFSSIRPDIPKITSLFLELCVDCAVADLIPTPEEIDPPMNTIINEWWKNSPTEGSTLATCGTFDWSKTSEELSVAIIRRMPRLPDDSYPIIKFSNVTPNCLHLPPPSSSSSSV